MSMLNKTFVRLWVANWTNKPAAIPSAGDVLWALSRAGDGLLTAVSVNEPDLTGFPYCRFGSSKHIRINGWFRLPDEHLENIVNNIYSRALSQCSEAQDWLRRIKEFPQSVGRDEKRAGYLADGYDHLANAFYCYKVVRSRGYKHFEALLDMAEQCARAIKCTACAVHIECGEPRSIRDSESEAADFVQSACSIVEDYLEQEPNPY